MRIFRHGRSRRTFFLLWGSWSAVALLFAALYDWFHEAGFLMGVVLIASMWTGSTAVEMIFRRSQLPWEARRPWHAILVLPVLMIPVLVMMVGPRFHHYLPGSVARQEHCQIVIQRLNATERDLSFSYRFSWEKSNWGPSVRDQKFSETRIWMGKNEERGWIIDPELAEAHWSQDSKEKIKLGPEGYRALVDNFVGDSVPAAQVDRAAAILRKVLTRRTSIPMYSRGPQYWLSRDSDSGRGRASLWPWLWVGAVLFSLCLFPVTAVVVSSTMYPRSHRR